MAHERLEFPRIDWQSGAHPLERKKTGALGGATLLRFEPGFEDPNWCVNGHAGYVLEGTLRLAFDEGVVEVREGEGFVIDPGTRHRAANAGRDAVAMFIAPRGAAP
ncbi:MAG: cupin domain-containing protein [Acidobacteria bacterium]|jgi:quercetin dioxygenase-like cupin family protein|nr:cupin domain-containing protein [Acidobacteriota bacterium]